ncbi:MAG: penicillin-binding protein 2, partial [Opitutales bacterium]|nr:penicillin-binding protein 2 [Opitutales bacterium]
MRISPFISKQRYMALCLCAAAFFCVMVWKLYDLHIVEAPNSREKVSSQRQVVRPINAKRGNITDARGNLLASSRPVIDLGVDPEAIAEIWDKPGTREKLAKMSEILGVPLPEILEKCKREQYSDKSGRTVKARWRLIGKIEENVYEEISALKIYGIKGDRKYVRGYPSNALACHVIGFVNKEGTPVCGIESAANWYLNGQEGWIQGEKDARRREIAHFRTREVPAVDGMNIELSIDIVIQEMANRQLQKIVDEFHPENATIIVSDPATGFILALANYPAFDPNKYNQYPIENLKNFAISSQIEPGSTFKIVPISAALNENLVTQDDTFDCASPTMEYRGRTLKLPPDDHPAG